MKREDLESLCARGVLSPLDYHFGAFMTRLSGRHDPELFLAAALVSKATGQGHVCFDLSSMAEKVLIGEENGTAAIHCPRLDDWRAKIDAAPVVGAPGEYRPLILDDKHRLYLYRYWEYESSLARFVKARATALVEDVDEPLLMEGLARHFDEPRDGETDWQAIAALTSATRRLCIISGGPGTGKTTTVARILALLLEQKQPGGKKLRISLIAPTGKAATRLEEAIGNAKSRLRCSDALKEAIPGKASTIHRFLGAVHGSPYFRHNSRNPLTADVVIVDEASMVDLALMAKLVSALPDHARLILLGDKDQLASVEAGAVLGDICNTARPSDLSDRPRRITRNGNSDTGLTSPPAPDQSSMLDCIVELRRSYRFGEDSGIGALSRAVRDGDGALAMALLRKDSHADIEWMDLPGPDALSRSMKAAVVRGFTPFLKASTLQEMSEAFERFRILSALRKGPFGAAALNGLVEDTLWAEGLIERGAWYVGRPIMITRNDYNLKLYNGDIGFIVPAGGGDAGRLPHHGSPVELAGTREMRAAFPVKDGPPRTFPAPGLPEHETVYATTVHKSQGSEFDEVHLVLPDRESPVLTRELLYTGITRARKKVVLWAREEVFRAAISMRVERSSGLRDAIWSTPE
jgi:exodeoxyribonuclease V alpha subunit